jgi:hypothetical protein
LSSKIQNRRAEDGGDLSSLFARRDHRPGRPHGSPRRVLFEGLSLPRRASVLQTLVQACDMAAISENLLPVPPNDLPE